MSQLVKLARQVAAEGMVLLQNTDQVLPLKSGDRVAVFGRCQLDYYKSGTGSGGAVHVPYRSNVIDGLYQYKNVELNEGLLEIYKTWVAENPFDDGGGGWAAEPWYQKEMLLENDLVLQVREQSDKALVIIGRTAGEDQDNKDVPGSYRLTTSEIDMLDCVTKHFDNVVVILNVSNIIDMSWLKRQYKYPIKGVLYAWHGGMEGGNALADILVGKCTPSGKLTDTIGKTLSDYPSNNQFGDKKENYYEEDIYVGYRYFETFKPSAVLFPFGFGLSYTTFEVDIEKFKIETDGIEVSLRVKNTGFFPGKEVVQLYYGAPQGKLGKAKLVLGDFIKTKTLNPNASEVYQLKIKYKQMASYDDSGVTGHKSCYVLEDGQYDFYVGTSIQLLKKVGSNKQSFEVVEQLQEALSPVKPFERFKACENNGKVGMIKEPVPLKTIDLSVRMTECLPLELPMTHTTYGLDDVAQNKITLDEFVGQLSHRDLATLVKAEGMCSPKVTTGTASAFGGLSRSLQKYGLPVLACADGPSGIRMDNGKTASQVPIGTLLACSWNTDLVEKLYREVGRELVENHIDTLLGPGMNIHRHPLNGRNFEYFSEDPFVTGKFAVAMIKGLRKGGSTGTLKHFIANNQEEARHLADSVVSERALREIYLKGFEMAVKDGGASSIMTSYNPVNGIYTASNYDLNTSILRNEWGFEGIVMTDWWAKVNHPVLGGEGAVFNLSYMVKAQNDLYMVVDHDMAQEFENDDLFLALEEKKLTIGELQRSAKNICKFILSSHSFLSKEKHTNKRFFQSKTETVNRIFGVDEVVEVHVFALNITEAGPYDVMTSARYQSTTLAQATYNLCINGEVAFMTQMHGSDEDFKTRHIATMDLEPGYYDIELVFIRKGIEVREILFKKNKSF